jgi:hypothetical protein
MLLFLKNLYNLAETERIIVASVKSWLLEVNQIEGPIDDKIAKATRIFIKGDDRETKAEFIARAFVCRVSALIRLVVEHIHGISYNLVGALTPEEKDIFTLIQEQHPSFIKAACLTPVIWDDDRPAFDLGEFTEKLHLVKTLWAKG